MCAELFENVLHKFYNIFIIHARRFIKARGNFKRKQAKSSAKSFSSSDKHNTLINIVFFPPFHDRLYVCINKVNIMDINNARQGIFLTRKSDFYLLSLSLSILEFLNSWIQRQTHNLWFILTLFHPSNTAAAAEVGRSALLFLLCWTAQHWNKHSTFCVCILLSPLTKNEMNAREKR